MPIFHTHFLQSSSADSFTKVQRELGSVYSYKRVWSESYESLACEPGSPVRLVRVRGPYESRTLPLLPKYRR